MSGVNESQISKNSFEKMTVANESMTIDRLNDQLRERDISPQKTSKINRGNGHLKDSSVLTKSPILV